MSFERGYETFRALTGYETIPCQETFLRDRSRHKIWAGGRQIRKTTTAAIEALVATMGTEDKPAPLVWLVGGTYAVLDEMWNHIREWTAMEGIRDMVQHMTNKPMELDLHMAGRLRGKSAEDPDLLRGPALDKLVVEEAELLSDYAINHVFLPMFNVTRGGLIGISSPQSRRHWFYRWFLMGQDDEHPDIRSFTNSSYDNPDADPQHIAFLKTILPESSYKREIMGEFPDDDDQVFRRVREAISAKISEPIPGKPYVIGVDWAKVHDFTVLVVGDCWARSVVHVERFHKQDYNLQVSRLRDLAHRFNNAGVLMDSTGVGDPILDMCSKAGIRCEGYQYTWKTKKQAIDALAVAIETGQLRLIDHPQLIRELEAYEQIESSAHNVKYGAPQGEGYYDDCVSSLALMWWHMQFSDPRARRTPGPAPKPTARVANPDGDLVSVRSSRRRLIETHSRVW